MSGDAVELVAPGGAYSTRIPRRDLELLKLLDGTRSTVAAIAFAHENLGIEIDRDRFEGLISDVATAGLMAPGRDEPLPVPAHFASEAALLGWVGTGRTLPALPDAAVLPPSTVPGSRSGPGYLGSIMGLISGKPGEPNRLRPVLPEAPFVWLGWPVAAMLAGPIRVTAFLAAFVTAVVAIALDRHAWVVSGLGLVGGYHWVVPVLLGFLLVNLSGTAVRAAAVARFTPGRIRVGVLVGRPFPIPRLFVDTAGAAENANRANRQRVIGAGLAGIAALIVLGVVAWSLFRTTAPIVAECAVATTCIAIVTLILRLNPVAMFEGYYLLAQGLGHPDLRKQAWNAAFGAKRPWPTAAGSIPRKILLAYGALAMLYIVVSLVMMYLSMGTWLSHRFGGIGFLIYAIFPVVTITNRLFGSGRRRSSLGRPKQPFRIGKPIWIAAAVTVVVALLPYHYEPSGPVTLLPEERADVVALVPGDVREILAAEGQMVQQGQDIVRLDDGGLRAAVAEAEAAVAAKRAELALVEGGAKSELIDLARQAEAVAHESAELAKADAARMTTAFKGRAVTAADMDRSAGAADVAQGRWLEAQHQLQLVSADARPEAIAHAKAELDEVVAELDRRRTRLDNVRVRAPVGGRLVAPDLRDARGRYLAQGSPVAQVESPVPCFAEIEMAEGDAHDLRLGAAAVVRPWMLGGRALEGRVVAIAPAAEDGEEGRFVRVRLALDGAEGRVLSGVTGVAKVDGGWHPTVLVFGRALGRWLLVRVWSWLT